MHVYIPIIANNSILLCANTYHYTKIIVVRASVRASVHTDGSSPEASRPQRKKLCFFAKLKSGAATRGSQTRPVTVLALD